MKSNFFAVVRRVIKCHLVIPLLMAKRRSFLQISLDRCIRFVFEHLPYIILFLVFFAVFCYKFMILVSFMNEALFWTRI